LRLTQEFIAQMLGVHRPSVSIAMGALQRAGLIERVSRGTIVIRDRRGLEEAACECYQRVRDYESLLAQPGTEQAHRA
jgi:Mn-dependent DtxR family transcriptional regulator